MSTRQDVLVAPLEQLESALGAPAPGREHDWAREVESILGRIEEALRHHVVDTDAPGGMFTKVDLTRPTLVRQVGALRQEHVSFLQRTGALRQEVRSAAGAFAPPPPAAGAERLPAPAAPEGVPDFGAMRQELERLATALKQHRDAEAGLVIESVATDIGVGD
jgi:hypothetical protein